MKKRIGVCVVICVCIVFVLFVLQVNAEDINSKYATMDLSVWLQYDTEDNRFIKPEDFLLEVDEAIESITKYLNITCTKKVNIIFGDGLESRFEGKWNTILINRTDLEKNIPPIAHEVTHFLTESSLGGLNEGLASLMQEKFGKNPDIITLGYPVHSLAKSFLQSCDPVILKSIVEGGLNYRKLNVDDTFYFYLFSHSWVKYLIETYGVEKFMCFFNNTYTETYQSVFDVDSETIKNNWLQYISSQADLDLQKWRADMLKLLITKN